jgi:hypothetical protein
MKEMELTRVSYLNQLEEFISNIAISLNSRAQKA